MEQQKVLWIVFSVTLFLVVVVVVGFVWFLPPEKESKPGELAAGAEPSAEVFDPIMWVREDEVPGIEIPQADTSDTEEESQADGDLLLVYGEADEAIDGPDIAAVDAESEAGRVADVKVVEEVRPTTVTRTTRVVAAEPVAPRAEPRAIVPPSGAPRAAAPAAVTPSAVTPRTEHITQYWIQAGSFRNQSKAEGTQAKLAEKGWHTRIISREVSGEIYYRVRLGPFDTKGEADKFLNWITDIESFETSYISQVYTTRAIN